MTPYIITRAGPLLGNASTVVVHCYLDGVYVSCIFNNQTAITAMVAPSADAVAGVTSFGDDGVAMQVQAESWKLALPE